MDLVEPFFPVARFSAARTFDCVFRISRLRLQARATILCVISSDEIATRSCGLRLRSRMIRATGCSAKLRPISECTVTAAAFTTPR